MAGFETIGNLAEEVLVLKTSAQGVDKSLLDRANRLARSCEYISMLPEIVERGVQIDRMALAGAAYFYDAGLAKSLRDNGAAAVGGNGNGLDEQLLEVSGQIAEKTLAGHIDNSRIRKVVQIIAESANNFTRWTEAMVLADALNLEDMGAVGVFNEIGRVLSGGKGATSVLKSWKRKVDYRYWQARLKEGFKFAAVREVAEKRLAATEQFMLQLQIENEALDMQELGSEAEAVEVG